MAPVIVLLTQDGYEHCYVANRLASACPLSAIVVDKGRRQSGLQRLRHLRKKYTLGQLLLRGIGRLVSRVRGDEEQRRAEFFQVLGREDCEAHRHKELVTCVAGINSDHAFGVIGALKPDWLLVYGTSIVSDRILALASRGALNMHTGISPYYRGADCYFWPLYNDELDMLGATVHECTSQVDGGAIYATGHARLEADDRLFSVFARCVKVGADLYVKTVQDLIAGDLKGDRQQPGIGCEYRSVMKNWGHEWVVRRKIKQGLIRNYVRRRPAATREGEILAR